MRRLVVALANTLALICVSAALVAALVAAWLTWGMVGAAWAAVPCLVIAAAAAFLLGWWAEGEDSRHEVTDHGGTGPARGTARVQRP